MSQLIETPEFWLYHINGQTYIHNLKTNEVLLNNNVVGYWVDGTWYDSEMNEVGWMSFEEFVKHICQQ